MKNRNFRLLFAGSLASSLGSVLCTFATSLFLLDVTGSAAMMSLYLAYTMALSLLLQPVMGALCDRMQKRRVMYLCDFAFGITDILLALCIFGGAQSTFLLVAVFVNSTVNTIAAALFGPASQAMLPLVVEEEHLHKAYSRMGMMQSAVSIFGLVFAAAAYEALGYAWILVMNGTCVSLSGCLEMAMRVRENPEYTPGQRLLSQLKEGLAYMLKKPALPALALCAVITNIFLSGVVSVTLPYMIYQELKLHPSILTAAQLLLSVGGMAVSMLLSRQKALKAGDMIPKGFFVFFLVFVTVLADYMLLQKLVIGVDAFTVILCAAFLLFGGFLAAIQIPTNASNAKLVEPAYMGRVMALRSTLSAAASPLAVGWMVDASGVLLSLFIGCLGMLFSFFFALRSKPLRTL